MRVLFVGQVGRDTLVPALESTDVSVTVTADAADAAARATGRFDCVVVADTVDFSPLLRRLDSPVVFLSTGNPEALNAASAAGGVDAVVALSGDTGDTGNAVDVIRRVAADAAFDADTDRTERLGALVARALRDHPDPETVCEWVADEYGVAWVARVEDDALQPVFAEGVSAGALAAHPLPDEFDAGSVAVVDELTALRLGDDALCIGTAVSAGDRRALSALADALSADPAVETFSGALGHELNNHLQSVRTYLDLANETGDTAHVASALSILERVDGLAEDAAALATRGSLDRTAVSLADVATDAWERTGTDDATLSVTEDRTVDADPGLLALLFENLLRNSVDHAGRDCRVSVGATPDGFFVADDGPGIPETERGDVFDWGYTTDGNGVGLALVAHVADRHGWTVSVSESETGGARFDVTL